MRSGDVARAVVTTAVYLLLPVPVLTTPARAQIEGPRAYAHAELAAEDVTALAFSPNGRFLAVGSDDGALTVFDVEAARAVLELEAADGPVVGLRFTPDGDVVWVASERGGLHEVDIVGGEVSASVELEESIRSLDASPDGRLLLAAGDDGHVEVLTDRLRRQTLLESPNLFDKRVIFAAFGNGGSEVFAAAEDDGRTAFWALGEPDPIRVGELVREEFRAFARDRDGQLLALGVKGLSLARNPSAGGAIQASAQHVVRLLDWERGRIVREIEGLPSEIRALAVSPDRAMVVVALDDGTLDGYATRETSRLMSIQEGADVDVVAFSPSGSWLAAALEDGPVSIWEMSGVTVADAATARDVVREGDVLADQAKFEFTTGREPLITGTERFTMAVLDLDNMGVEADLAAAVSNLVVSRLANVPFVELTERSALEGVMEELEFQSTGLTSAQDAAQIGQILNAERVLVGNVNQLGTTVTVQLRLVETEAARVVGAREILCRDCRPEDLPRAVTLLVSTLVEIR